MTLGAGSIGFVGFNADGNDNLAFVTFENIAAGTVITFTDNEWTGSAFNTGESTWTWTATSDIAAGAVITMDNLAAGLTSTSNLGTITWLNETSRGLDTGPEAVSAFTGTTAAPTFLTMFSNGALNNTQYGVLNGTGLTAGVSATGFGSSDTHDIAIYSGPHATTGNLDALRPAIFNVFGSNTWTAQNTAGDDSHDGVGPDAPFDATPFAFDPNAQKIFFSAGTRLVAQNEGNSGTTTYTFVVERSNGTTGQVDFSGTLTPGTTATNEADFGGTLPTAFSGTIADGATSGTVTVTITGDTNFESTDRFLLKLTTVTNSAAGVYLSPVSADVTAQGNILNDDPQPTIGFAADSLQVLAVEGNDGTTTVTLTVERLGDLTGDVSFRATFARGSTNADDFGGTEPGVFNGTIAAGQSSGTFTVTFNGDITPEDNEAFTFTLDSVTNSAGVRTVVANAKGSAQVNILNDDPWGTIHSGETVNGIGLTGHDTLTVEQGGIASRISVLGKDFDVTIDNAGTVGANHDAVFAAGQGNGKITFNNEATGEVGDFTVPPFVSGGSIEFTINNAGKVTGGIGFTFAAPDYDHLTINNLAGGFIYSIKHRGDLTVANAGTITGPENGIEYNGGVVSLHNLAGGLIEGAHHAFTGNTGVTVINDAGGTMIGDNGSAVNIDNSSEVEKTVTVINRGVMQGKSASVPGSAGDSDGDAIDIDGLAVIENWGTVEGLGHNGYHNQEANVSEGIAIGGGSIVNHAGGSIYGYGRAIEVDNSNNGNAPGMTTIVNGGTIKGDGHLPFNLNGEIRPADLAFFMESMPGGEAINIVGTFADTLTNEATGAIIGGVKMGGGNDTVVNKGTMTATGGSALNLGAGDDTFDAYVGSKVTGLIDGGEGSDTLNLRATAGNDGLGKVGQFANIEQVNVLGGNWSLENGAGSADVTVQGGTLSLAAGTSSTGEIVVKNGAGVYDYGSTSDATVQSGGALHVYQGGTANNTTVEAGGYLDVWNGTVTGTSLYGNQQVLDGGSAIDTTIESGGYQYVGAGGETEGTAIETGGVQYVDSTGTATDTSVRGAQHVYNGGQAFNSTVEAGGYQDVANATVTGTDLSGNQQVLSGGSAVDTTVRSGGRQFVATGGSTEGTVVEAGGLQYVDAGAIATDTTINGGYLHAGGTVNGVVIDNGGELFVAGTANDTDIVNGVTHVAAGGVQNGVDFGGGEFSALVLDDASGLTGTVEDFEVGDFIGIANTSVSSFGFDGATLTLETSTGTIAYQFSGLAADAVFNVTSDGHGGSAIALLAQHAAGFGATGAGESSSLPQQDMTTVQPMLASAA